MTISETLRRALRDRFDELVHPEGEFEVEIDVRIEGFVPGSVVVETKKESDESEPFTGPRYPID